jgi:hypothetical protein
MATENTDAPIQQMNQETEQPAWYDFLIDIFKKLLELNNFSYGTKKNF